MDTAENSAKSALSPQITNEYNIIRLLGEGGMGEVYLAEQLRVGRRLVALKVLNRACSENPELKKRFENEAASAGRIRHRNVVTVYESRATDDGQLYVAMEYLEGFDLGRVIDARGALPLDEVVEVVRQVAAGLAAAHKLGIVHRDIKPGNIMLTREDDGALVVKVLDFGIARLSEPDTIGSQTKTGVVMGTPHYMSPEQALGRTGDKIDHRSDIYSLAMVVYQMLTGKVAFDSDSWIQVMYKHVNDPPPPPSEVRPDLSYLTLVDSVVCRGLEKDREKRQQTVTGFANEFEAACAGHSAAGPDQVGTMIYPLSTGEPLPFDASASLLPMIPAASRAAGANIPTVAGATQSPGTSPANSSNAGAQTPSQRTEAEGAAGTTGGMGAGSGARQSAGPQGVSTDPSRQAQSTVGGTAGVGMGAEAQSQPTARPSKGKGVAAAVSGLILIALVAVAYVVIRGRNKPAQEIVADTSKLASAAAGNTLVAGSSATSAAPDATTSAAATTASAPSPSPASAKATPAGKEEAKKEPAAPIANQAPAAPIEDAASKPGRNPHENAAAPIPTSAPKPSPTAASAAGNSGGDAGDACLGVSVTGLNGDPVVHASVTVTDGGTVMTAFTGPLGRQRICGLKTGHTVTVTVVGRAGKRSGSKSVTIGSGKNFVEIQVSAAG